MFACIFVWMCVSVDVCVWMFECMFVWMYVSVCVCVCVCMHSTHQ